MTMAYDPGAIDATLAAAVGDDAALAVELRAAFRDSVDVALVQLAAAADEAEWQQSAARLRGLAASFGAVRLMALAAKAGGAAPGDAPMLRKLRRAIDRL